ncbi:MAG: Gfo/Idh/MocA family oxidoreductase [Alphaproteobacteria bacterium]|nr:Gfo/Idh/MocA family oxidoreductase [Alphaproteobacteria bacterium]
MKIGAIGLGNRIAHVYHELSQINQDADLVAFVDPQPIGKDYAEKNNFFPSQEYPSLNEMLSNEKLDLLMIGSPNHLHLDHIKIGLNAGIKIFAEKPIVVDEAQSFELAKLLGEFGQDQVLVGLVLRYSQHARSVRNLIDKNILGNIISIEASEHIMPWHGGFFMRNWRRKEKFSGGFMLEKCCHDIDFYNMIVGCRVKRVASFGGRSSFIPENKPENNLEEFTKYNLTGWQAKESVFDSDADIVDHQVAIIEYDNGATLAFHTNMRVPDEFRRFAVIGTNGMVEGDFVRGFLKAHDQQNNVVLDEDYGAAFGMVKGHYGADNLMLKDINQHLTNVEKINLPVGVKDCIEAGIIAMKIDESRKTGKIIDLTSSWSRLDEEMKN